MRLVTLGEQSIWLSISDHMKSPHRLNVALTRAKDGLAAFENFRSMFKAVRLLDTSENSFGKALSDFIADAVACKLEVVDPTKYTNPATLVREASTAAFKLRCSFSRI